MNDRNKQLEQGIDKGRGRANSATMEKQIADWSRSNTKRLMGALGSEELAKKLVLTALNVVRKNVDLWTCEPDTLFQCLLLSAELNLFPGAAAECAYVPMREKGVMKANFWPMVNGIVKLVYNSGQVRSVNSAVVYEADHFEFELGSNQRLIHVPSEHEERGRRRAVWCVIKTIYGGEVIRVLAPKFIADIRDRSAGAKSSFSPWNSKYDGDVDGMWEKTAIKQAAKKIPKSDKLAVALEVDDVADAGARKVFQWDDLGGLQDVTPQAGPVHAGEPVDATPASSGGPVPALENNSLEGMESIDVSGDRAHLQAVQAELGKK